MATAKWTTPSTIETWISSEVNSLANNAGQSGSVITSDGLLYADLELYVTFGVSPTANSLVEVYFVRRIDGTNWEDFTPGSSAVGPANGYVGGFPVAATTNAQRIMLPRVELPPLDFQVMVINKTGQAFAASGNTLKARRYSEQAA